MSDATSTSTSPDAPPDPVPVAPARIGPRNDITDVAGIRVGSHRRSGRGWLSGTTVVLTPPHTVAGVDVRGGGPGTRETETLRPENLVEHVNAICLSGGSAYGLDAASGVVRWLAEHDTGLQIGPAAHHVVPIVPAAVLFDLGAGGNFRNRPDAEFGYRAAANAARGRCAAPVEQGAVGAGTGSHAQFLKGGLGSASVVLSTGITVAALVALNSAGSVHHPDTGRLWGLDRGIGDEFAGIGTPSRADVKRHHGNPLTFQPLNTTLAVVATDARLDKAECTRLAIAAHDGMARSISPIHRYVDGDVAFTLATGAREIPLPSTEGGSPIARDGNMRRLMIDELIAASADAVARAIVHAALKATTAGALISYLDRFPSARRS